MAYTNTHFPSQAVSDLEKLSEEYGLKVARAIKHEWFSRSTARFSDNISKFSSNLNNYHQLRRLEARTYSVKIR